MRAAELLAVLASLVAGAAVSHGLGLGDVVPPAAAGAAREAVVVTAMQSGDMQQGFGQVYLAQCDSKWCGTSSVNFACSASGAVKGVDVDLNSGVSGKYVYLCLQPFTVPGSGITSIRWVWTTGFSFVSWWDHTFNGAKPYTVPELCSTWLGGSPSEYRGDAGEASVDANEAAPGKYIWLCPRNAREGVEDENIQAVRVVADPDWKTGVNACMAGTSAGESKATTGDHNAIMDLNMGNSGNWVFACTSGVKRCPSSYPIQYGSDVGGFCCSVDANADGTCPGKVCALDPTRPQGNIICP